LRQSLLEAKRGETVREMATGFCLSVSVSYSRDF
jgi:hypothetical protein